MKGYKNMIINLNMYELLKDFSKLRRKISILSAYKFEVTEKYFSEYEIRLLEILEEYDFIIDYKKE